MASKARIAFDKLRTLDPGIPKHVNTGADTVPAVLLAEFARALMDKNGNIIIAADVLATLGASVTTLAGAISVADPTTPSVSLATGKSNTGFFLVYGKTSGGTKYTTADATGQTVTILTAAQTVGASTWTIPDAAGAAQTFMTLQLAQTVSGQKTFVAPILGAATGTSLAVTGLLTSSSPTAGIGYATGAGGTVTQGTSRATAVTLNTVCGNIVLFSAAGSATPFSFTLTNSTIAAGDTVRICQKSGTDLYTTQVVTATAAGSCQITLANASGTTTEQPVFNFSVLKGVAA